jgi:murein DD-endopeptidase MepM/ murein hydrolase activator NlpD
MRVFLIAVLGGVLALAPAPVRVSTSASPIRPGSVVLLTIAVDRTAAALSVHAFDREFPAFEIAPGRWQSLVGVDLDVAPAAYQVSVDAGPEGSTTHPLLVLPREFRTRMLKVDPTLVTPPPQEMDRVTRETELVRGLLDAPPTAKLWQGAFVRPVADPANSSFGTRSIYNGEPRTPHTGTDFLSPTGRPVAAPNAGRVVLAGPLYFTGGTVIVDHGLGVVSLFAHLSAIDVREGEMVRKGAILGKVGATGRVTGPHLHWTVRISGARVDPLSLLAALRSR